MTEEQKQNVIKIEQQYQQLVELLFDLVDSYDVPSTTKRRALYYVLDLTPINLEEFLFDDEEPPEEWTDF